MALNAAIRQAATPMPISAQPKTSAPRLSAIEKTQAPMAATSSRNVSTRRGPGPSRKMPSGPLVAAQAMNQAGGGGPSSPAATPSSDSTARQQKAQAERRAPAQ